MKKRLFSLALVLAMILSVVPFSLMTASAFVITEIESIELTAVYPVAGFTPLEAPISVPEGADYQQTKAVIYGSWYDAETNLALGISTEFESGKTYIGYALLEANTHCTFADELTATVNGEVATVNMVEISGNTYAEVTFEYTINDVISNISIVGVSEPVKGEYPSFTATIETEGFEFATTESGVETDLIWIVQNPFTNPDGRDMAEDEAFSDFAVYPFDVPKYYVMAYVKAMGVMLADELTATVNGITASIENISENYYLILCDMGTVELPSAEVIYSSLSNGKVGGTVEVDLEAMAESDDEFMEAYLDDSVSVQWAVYNPDTEVYTRIYGATDPIYLITEAESSLMVRAEVTYGNNTAYGEYFEIPNIYGAITGTISGVELDDIITVSLYQNGETVTSNEYTKTISELNYYFEDVREGEYTLVITCNGYNDYSASVTIYGDTMSLYDANLEKIAYLSGDVDGNGKVNMFDYMLVKSYFFNLKALTEEQIERADITDDGKVNMFDYMKIKAIVFESDN